MTKPAKYLFFCALIYVLNGCTIVDYGAPLTYDMYHIQTAQPTYAYIHHVDYHYDIWPKQPPKIHKKHHHVHHNKKVDKRKNFTALTKKNPVKPTKPVTKKTKPNKKTPPKDTTLAINKKQPPKRGSSALMRYR